MIHRTQTLGYIRELQVTGKGPNTEGQTDNTTAGTTHGIAQLHIGMVLMSGEDSAKRLSIHEE
jgi:hypothetical protein